MAAYMLLLRDEPSAFEDFSAEEMERIIGRYVTWRQELAAKDLLVGADKLTDGEGRVLRRQSGALRVIDGPFSEAKEIVGGYFAVKAESYEAAVKIAESCPHLEFGSVEIRQIEIH